LLENSQITLSKVLSFFRCQSFAFCTFISTRSLTLRRKSRPIEKFIEWNARAIVSRQQAAIGGSSNLFIHFFLLAFCQLKQMREAQVIAARQA